MLRIPLVILMLTIVPILALAAAAEPGPVRMERVAPGVGDALAAAMERDGMARVELTLDLNERSTESRDSPAAGSGVHPAVFDLVMMASGGPMQIDQAGDFHLLRLGTSKAALPGMLAFPEVVAVRLDSKPLSAGPIVSNRGACPATSTRACLSNSFSVSVNYGGVLGKVAAVGGDSASFWAYSSNNWEVLAKVLNGCGINNHWWLFGAAAGTSSYSVSPVIWLAGGSLHLGSWSASNKPIVNLQLFSCS